MMFPSSYLTITYGKRSSWWHSQGASSYIFVVVLTLTTIPLKDLLARDQDIHHLLKEESLTLDDIILSDVCTVPFSP